MRKGMYLTLDAILAALLLVLVFVALSQYTVRTTDRTATTYVSQDVLLSLETLTLGEIEAQNPNITALITDTLLTENDTVLFAIGFTWVLNDTRLADLLQVVSQTVPVEAGFRINADNTTLYEQGTNGTSRLLSTAIQQVTGIDEGQPVAGTTSSAHLKKIRDKKTSTFTYFGGFTGQGNLSVLLNMPASTNVTNITALEMELDVETLFHVYINGTQCGGDFTPVQIADNFTPDIWDITNCSNLLGPGENEIELRFPDSVNDAFVGGGFIKVTYLTDAFQESTTTGFTQKLLPGVSGIVNLYDGVRVPGTLTNLTLSLHYKVNRTVTQNYTFYVVIGSTTVYAEDTTSGDQIVTFTNLTAMLNYTELSNTTVPIRIGFQNLTFETSFQGNADVALVTDVSGSMDWRMDSNSVGTLRNCLDASYNASSTRRISVAKCLDSQFLYDILNYTGNRLALVSYDGGTNDAETVDLTQDTTTLNNTIGTSSPLTGYTAGGSTCICCGINTAAYLLTKNHVTIPIIRANEQWYYNDSYLGGVPPNDAENDTWYEADYSFESDWASGTAILGAENGDIYTPGINTTLDSNLSGSSVYVDFWENVGDVAGPPADFTSGTLNSTANTYGYSSANDGWDWDTENNNGPFGYDDDISYYSIVGGELEFESMQSGQNRCSSRDCSGAYGITITITAEMQSMLNEGGSAFLTFDYEWDSDTTAFENNDQAWVKARFTTPTGTATYLGEDLDAGHSGGDSDVEVATVNNPNTDIAGTFFADLTQLITEGAGDYYLEIGGKLRASATNEFGYWRFDDIELEVSNATDRYYFRKHFTVRDPANSLYPDLWENIGDTTGYPNDFSSGILNSTANTYGYSSANDGWDWDTENGNGPFGDDDDIVYDQVKNGQIQLHNSESGSNSCSSNDCTGAYGITVTVTPDMATRISQGSYAVLQLDYAWTPNSTFFETDDHVWVKARFTTPTGTATYLGEDIDDGFTGQDSGNEVAHADNPNDALSGTFVWELSSLITEGAGDYYLELGGKLRASASNEIGTWTFDNVQLRIGNMSTDLLQKGLLNVLSDSQARVYLNGQQVFLDNTQQTASYWNSPGITIPFSQFVIGDNLVAVELTNGAGAAKFDLSLRSSSTSKQLAMLVMSDGVANVECSQQGTGDSSQDAIQAACDTSEEDGVIVHSVGFSSAADEVTLAAIATCGNGLFEESSNTTALTDFYQNVAFSILEASLQSQSVVVQGTFQESTLYNDSYVNVTYNSSAVEPDVGEIELVVQTPHFGSCTPTVSIPQGLRIAQAHITSYSGDHWTDYVSVNGVEVYNLSRFSSDYIQLGDPYLVEVPTTHLTNGDNTFFIRTGDAPGNSTGCSANNSLVYTAYAPSATSRTPVFEYAEGCNWTIESESGDFTNVSIPTDYTGALNCSYTNASISYNISNAVHIAVYDLLRALDFDMNGRILVNLDEDDLEIVVTDVQSVPFLWGPVVMKAEAWQ